MRYLVSLVSVALLFSGAQANAAQLPSLPSLSELKQTVAKQGKTKKLAARAQSELSTPAPQGMASSFADLEFSKPLETQPIAPPVLAEVPQAPVANEVARAWAHHLEVPDDELLTAFLAAESELRKPQMAPAAVEPLPPIPVVHVAAVEKVEPTEAPLGATPSVAVPETKRAVAVVDELYLPVTCIGYTEPEDAVEYEVKKGGAIARKAAPEPRAALKEFIIKPGDTLRAVLTRWAAPEYTLLWEAEATADFELGAPADFGKNKLQAVNGLIAALQEKTGLSMKIYTKNKIWTVTGDAPANGCSEASAAANN